MVANDRLAAVALLLATIYEVAKDFRPGEEALYLQCISGGCQDMWGCAVGPGSVDHNTLFILDFSTSLQTVILTV